MAVQSRSPSAFCSRLANPLVPSSRPACALPPYAPASPPSREPPPPPSVPPPSAPPRSQLRADSQPCPPEGAACQGEAAVASPPAQPQQEQPRRLQQGVHRGPAIRAHQAAAPSPPSAAAPSAAPGCIAVQLPPTVPLHHYHQQLHHHQPRQRGVATHRSPGSGTILPFPHSNVEMTGRGLL